MREKKLKILMLGFDDNELVGHVFDTYKTLPDYYDKRIVVLQTVKHKYSTSFFDRYSLFDKFRFKIYCYINRLKQNLAVDTYVDSDKNKQEYHFAGNEFGGITAECILKKCNGFIPDIISIHWVSNFISSYTIRRLHELTNASIVFFFVDEAHMTGGCHYPMDCKGYLSDCYGCPALKHGKDVARVQLKKKKENLRGIPVSIVASPYDCNLALRSSLFREVKRFPYIRIPEVVKVDSSVAQKHFSILEDDFVIMIGSAYLGEVRKGILYSLEAIKKFAKWHSNICILALGHIDSSVKEELSEVKILTPGYLSREELFIAFCASNCFLSTTIADSGPMMVNYAITMGIPVVSFNIGIAQDLVIHRKTGYIAKFEDSADVAKGIEFIYQSDTNALKNNCFLLIQQLKNADKWYEQLYDDNAEVV